VSSRCTVYQISSSINYRTSIRRATAAADATATGQQRDYERQKIRIMFDIL